MDFFLMNQMQMLKLNLKILWKKEYLFLKLHWVGVFFEFSSNFPAEAAEKEKKQKEEVAEPAGQRKLMEISDTDPYALTIYPIQIRSTLMRLNKVFFKCRVKM
jgi:hypothetical protein